MKIFWYDRYETVFLHPIRKIVVWRDFGWKKREIIVPDRRGIGIVWRNFRKFSKVYVDLVAQLVEHNTFNVGALGSSPSGITRVEGFERCSNFFVLNSRWDEKFIPSKDGKAQRDHKS